jgi:ABC-type multidrug transport system ATPase subunit/pSer/pThr/pTyr-binding forkhead associated (FHA) protein
VRYRLVHLNGSLAGQVRDFDDHEVVLGRDPHDAQVVFGAEDHTVSRRHASLTASDGVLLLRDLESSTGTFLAGADIEEAELVDGDVFELGEGGPRVRVEMQDGATIVTAAPPAEAVLPTPPTPAAAPSAARPPGPGSKLRLTFASGTREGSSLELAGSVFRMGRAQECAVWTPSDTMVSGQHAKVVRLPTGYVLIDLESTNGTYLNGRRIQRATLSDGDIVALGAGGPQIRIQILSPERAAVASAATISIPRFAELAGRKTQGARVKDVVLQPGVSAVGRDPAADIHLDSPIVSRFHARVGRRGDIVTVEDLDSANGTYLNGRRITRSEVAIGDLLVVGPFQLVIDRAPATDATGAPAPLVVVRDTRDRARLDARGVTLRADGQAILQDISLSIGPGCFVAVIGPSGSGKSTLLSVLSGIRATTEGDVLLNGGDLHRAFDSLKSRLGYVPQDDIVHRELTVEESLGYTARLRLPPDTPAAERDKHVADVLSTLELTERRDVPIHRLSGGQRKRVSIATELLTEPSLIFLDEPTSGLDPGLEEALMLLLRELSYKGKTVVLVTHTLDHIDLCDSVALVMDGRLAFFGPAAEAKTHFGIDHIVNLYTRLKEKSGEAWSADFTAQAPTPPAERAKPADPPEARRRQGAGRLRQLAILTSRYFRTVSRDGRNAALLIAQAPLIAYLIGLSLLYGGSDIAYTKPKNTILFLLAMTAVWFGCSNAARELVKERAIYLRERMVNLRIIPYVLSKVVVLAAFAFIQCVLLLFILDVWFGVPGSMGLLLGGMLLASLVGILLGLALSALVGSADRAMTLLPILLIPQVLFTIPAVQMDMKGPAGIVARAMPTWWAYDLLRRVALEPDAHASDDAIDARLQEGGPVLMTRDRFEDMVQQGYMLFQHRGAIETTWTASLPDALAKRLPARLGYWGPAAVDALALGAFALALLAAAIALQRRHDRRG